MEFTDAEHALLRSLDTPQKIQAFIDAIPTNREPEGDTCISPLRVLRENRAHCIEAAMLAAYILMLHGERPLLVDLEANKHDQDHVLCVYTRDGCWGAIAKTNHASLGYRDPVYRSVRELVMSYFHEYLNTDGRKTLRRFSTPVDLRRIKKEWITAQRDVWHIPEALIRAPHTRILTRAQERALLHADPFIRDASNIPRQLRRGERRTLASQTRT